MGCLNESRLGIGLGWFRLEWIGHLRGSDGNEGIFAGGSLRVDVEGIVTEDTEEGDTVLTIAGSYRGRGREGRGREEGRKEGETGGRGSGG